MARRRRSRRSCVGSHPTRGEWIEIARPLRHQGIPLRLTPHGVSGLKLVLAARLRATPTSHPTRGEWIEIGSLRALVL